ncbi:hypothetical protein HPP92_022062 [Vanilla planifolia]|uniref:GEX2 N-terminal Ig-like domain-containing protein n=1 Tax=Vanilla planifolia TaxID=51239 RepID=A0A835UDG6_VANPL|nr:hypothetical protein HPP92_022062 [Vanilla planifolia]
MRGSVEVFYRMPWFAIWIVLSVSATADDFPSEGFRVKVSQPRFAVSWLDDRSIYQAGDAATVRIKLLDNSFNGNLSTVKLYFSVSVCWQKGNSSYISAVFLYVGEDSSFYNISFTPIRVGEFSLIVVEDFSGVSDSSLHFRVIAGHIYPSACLPSWNNVAEEVVAGMKAFLLVFAKDAFGNNISSMEVPSKDYFILSATYQNGSLAENFNLLSCTWNELGYFGIEFIPTIAGSLLLHICGDNQTLNGSPLPFLVKPGILNISNSIARWKYEINSLQIFSKLEIFIYQKDQFGNSVPGFYPFDARVVQKETGLSVPVADLSFEVVAYGVQLLSFAVSEPGEFALTIFKTKLNESISNAPYPFSVFVGYCHGLNSFANGSGLIKSVAGRVSYFTVFLKDAYWNPSPVEAEKLYVQIFSRNGSFVVGPIIFPLRSINGTSHGPFTGFRESMGNTEFAVGMASKKLRTFIGRSTIQASEFRVTYIPEKSGDYEILLFCGNIPLNNGSSYFMKASSGIVDISKSRVVNFQSKVKKLEQLEVFVQLVDSYWNFVSSLEAYLNLHFQEKNNSHFMRTDFLENKDGLYVGYYTPRDLGNYNICISFAEKFLDPCPIEFHVYESKYFPEAKNDSISVWEEESVIFDVLSNDYALEGQLSVVEFSKPHHGSLLQYGRMFRYTPFKGYFGNDSFTYTISDVNNNVDLGTAFISVLCKPPQFSSLPLHLNVTEDVMSPQFGGFPGFEIMYSDSEENISLAINAKFGSVYLAPTHIDISEPMGGMLSFGRGGRKGKDLVLTGRIGIINDALQLIQYLSNENFYGEDIISLYATNINGVQDSHVPVMVKPINDPPIIRVPKLIILGNDASDGFQIFDKQRDAFEFSVVDTDIFHYPGNRSHLKVMFSIELNDGLLSTTLPVHLIKTIELKTKSSNQWQPLQTYVTIANHFIMKGKGVRFKGTIADSNNAMQRLFYQGAGLDAMLTITINDLGNYGCSSSCTDMVSFPLSAEATVKLIKRRPLSSTMAFLLGSAIFCEIAMLFLLGGSLLFFICKCMNALQKERKISSSITKAICREESYDSENEKFSASTSLSFARMHFRERSRQGIRSDESQESELPLSYQAIGDYVQYNPSCIEMQRLRQHGND